MNKMVDKIKPLPKHPNYYPFELSVDLYYYRRSYDTESPQYPVKFLLIDELRTWLYENKIDYIVFPFFNKAVHNSNLGDEIHEFYNGYPSISFNREENAILFMLTFGGSVG